MSSCFVSGCNQGVEYICKCKTPPVFMCLNHMGNHYAAKCGQTPIHIDAPSVSPASRSLHYLSEVRNSILLTSNTLINLIKSETTKMIKIIQQEETIIRKHLLLNSSLSQSDKTKLESRKFFNIRFIQDDLLHQTFTFLSSANNSICNHLFFQYRADKEPKIMWTASLYPEMSKYEAKFACSRCGESKINQELFPNDLNSVCLICSGTKAGFEYALPDRDSPPPPPPPHGWPPGPPPDPPGWPPGGPPGGPPPWHHGGKHRHGGHGGHGGHGKEWKHKKHHREVTFCPPHIRPRCEFS